MILIPSWLHRHFMRKSRTLSFSALRLWYQWSSALRFVRVLSRPLNSTLYSPKSTFHSAILALLAESLVPPSSENYGGVPYESSQIATAPRRPGSHIAYNATSCRVSSPSGTSRSRSAAFLASARSTGILQISHRHSWS